MPPTHLCHHVQQQTLFWRPHPQKFGWMQMGRGKVGNCWDNNCGEIHLIQLPNSIYEPNRQKTLLWPLNWAQQDAISILWSPDGMVCYTTAEVMELEWDQWKFWKKHSYFLLLPWCWALWVILLAVQSFLHENCSSRGYLKDNWSKPSTAPDWSRLGNHHGWRFVSWRGVGLFNHGWRAFKI